ncbi:MAG: hypothetical protein CSA34_00070 [Desulfobulbus propionicus]|nr:MAG: hypothetical protein CSA34_00070 [Desulfobulbus propionicus]
MLTSEHFLVKTVALAAGCAALLLLGGCSSMVSVPYKINAEPEGSYLLMQVTGDDEEVPCVNEWVYLGQTPVQGIRQFDSSVLKKIDKVTLKVMHDGFVGQIREWDGEGFWREAEGKGAIYWTPELVETGN